MNRKDFIELLAIEGAGILAAPLTALKLPDAFYIIHDKDKASLTADMVIAGGGLGGCAAALAALRNGLSVIMTEETDWIGGQLTQQGVPPDEHQWIETHGATRSYRDLRARIRQYYLRHYPLTDEARKRTYLNPGDGLVSRLCHEPKVALAVLHELIAPFAQSGKLMLLTKHNVIHAEMSGNTVHSLKAVNMRNGQFKILRAPYFIDATELGDLLPLTGTEYLTGTESHADTDEFHAPPIADPRNNQAFTFCFAMDHLPGEDHVIGQPREYTFWRNYKPDLTPPWPGKLLDLQYTEPATLRPKRLGFHPDGRDLGEVLNLWNYRRIINKDNFRKGTYSSDITLVNWPQNDYMEGNIIDASPEEFKYHTERAKQLSLSLLYWLQTEVPRPDGGRGWPGLRLRKDVMGTEDGLARYPYIRESRRIRAVFTVLEEHVGKEQRAHKTDNRNELTAAVFFDSVGVGYYHIDLHPGCRGTNYLDFDSLPFQIPMGALLPIRIENLLPANKNIGTTHITNGCFRLHPVEWNIGEAAGLLIAYAKQRSVLPRQVREQKELLQNFQQFIREQGLETEWK